MNSGASLSIFSAGQFASTCSHFLDATRHRGPASICTSLLRAAEDDDSFDGLRQQIAVGILEHERVVDVLLQWHDRAAAEAAVGRDDHLRLRIKNAIRDRLRAEPAEHDRMHRADARAGEHRDGRLGDHRQINDARGRLSSGRFA